MYMAFYVINTLVVVLVFIVFCGFKVMEFLMFILKLSLIFRIRFVIREEKNLGNFLDVIKDKWIENCYEVFE